MKIENKHPSGLNFKSAVIIDFKNSGQSCSCSRDYDALTKAVRGGYVAKKGAVAFEIPAITSYGILGKILGLGKIIEGDKFIVANEAEKEALNPLWANFRDDYSLKTAKAFIKKTKELVKEGTKTIKY